MSQASSSLDTMSKGLLAALALAILVSIVILTRSFISVLSPSEQTTVQTQQSAQEPARTVSSGTESEWISSQQSRSSAEQSADQVSRFKHDGLSNPRNDAAAREAMVHMQAENLRNLARQNKLPEAYGNLTPKRIDEMEKNGIIIE